MGSGQSLASYNYAVMSGFLPPKYGNPNLKNDRQECLRLQINKVDIILEPLGPKEAHILSLPFKVISGKLPIFAPCVAYHASIFVYNSSKPAFGVMFEFGIYDERREGDYSSRVHYHKGNNGLRFVKMTYDELKKFKDTFFTSFIHCDVDNEMTVESFLDKVDYFYSWDSSDYHLILHNCQKFVAEAVKVLGAYRKPQDRHSSKDLNFIPIQILIQLETNEKVKKKRTCT